MSRAIDIIASIPRDEWIDLGYSVMVPSVLLIGLPLLILWFRP